MFIRLLINTIAIIISSYVLPGVEINSLFTALMVSVFLGIFNVFLKPILVILTLPINILTLGLFTLVINGLLFILISKIVPGFYVASFGTAVLFGLVVSIVNFFLRSFE